MQSTSNMNYWFQLNLTEMGMIASQNKDINRGNQNNIRPTESDIKGLNISDNAEDRYKVNGKGFRASDPLKMQKGWPLNKTCICDSQLLL